MNKTLRKALIFIALLIVVVLVIVLIAVLLPKSKTTGTIPASPSAAVLTPSPSVSVQSSAAASPSPSLSPLPSSSAVSSDAGSVTTEQTADGTKYNVTVPGSYVSYSLTADSAAVTHTHDSGSELFKLVKSKNAYVKITFLPGANATAAAPGFLDAYINYTNFEQSGKNYIDGTKLAGETVTADDGKTQVTAWLVDKDGGVLAVAMSFDLSEQKSVQPQLDKLLATMTVK